MIGDYDKGVGVLPEPDVLHIGCWFTDEDGVLRGQGPTGTDYGALDSMISEWFDDHPEYVQPIQLDITIRVVGRGAGDLSGASPELGQTGPSPSNLTPEQCPYCAPDECCSFHEGQRPPGGYPHALCHPNCPTCLAQKAAWEAAHPPA